MNALKKFTLSNSPSKLNNVIPGVGFGMWKVPKDVCPDLVVGAIQAGYRHLDCAADYGNEKEVGEGIKQAIDAGLVKREDLWITSKLWNTYHEPKHVIPACKKSLNDLGLDYLDLYLIHFPISLKYVPFDVRYPPEWFFDPKAANPCMEVINVPTQDTWRAMENLVKEGLVKNIGLSQANRQSGLSNFNCQHLRDVMSYAEIKPSVLQVEIHPYLQQPNLVRFAQSLGIHVTAFSPLGHGASYWNDSIAAIREPLVIKLAKKYGVTEAQIVLRFGIERDISVIPKSNNLERIKQNLDLFGFELSIEDMKELQTLEKNLRFNNPGVFCEQAFNTFCPIFD